MYGKEINDYITIEDKELIMKILYHIYHSFYRELSNISINAQGVSLGYIEFVIRRVDDSNELIEQQCNELINYIEESGLKNSISIKYYDFNIFTCTGLLQIQANATVKDIQDLMNLYKLKGVI